MLMRCVNATGAASLAAFLAAFAFSVGAARAASSAPAGPGTQSYLDLARKDCFGTARSTTSKVWYSVADGVLSDTFSPTIENSNVNTLQYIVTDGRLGGSEHPGRALRLRSGHGVDRLRRRRGGRLGHAPDLGRRSVCAAGA